MLLLMRGVASTAGGATFKFALASWPPAARCVTAVIAIEFGKLIESKTGRSAPGLLLLFIEIGELMG
jgi:hypothetical protein